MQLSQLSAAPQLIKITIDDEDTVKDFGEPVDFYMPDRTPLDTFLKLSSSINTDQSASIDILKTLIKDDAGNLVMTEGKVLPVKLMVKVMARVMEELGK